MKTSKGIADCSKETGCTQRQLRNFEFRGYIHPPVRITCGEIRYHNTVGMTVTVKEINN